ncbi:hypothetical protein [Stackebrandtia soli]|uniref:hypothetical protein n=1 Tax=Stackebrandtia soli TaxID=1892856 RepID=UPI0039EA41E0
MTDVDVVISGLRDHAGHLESDVVADMDVAIQAAGSVSAAANEDAYGVLCAPFLVPAMTAVEGTTLVAMAACRDAISRFATASNLLATVIDACDIDNEADLGDIGVDIVPIPMPNTDNPGDPVPMPDVDPPGDPIPMPTVDPNPTGPVAV